MNTSPNTSPTAGQWLGFFFKLPLRLKVTALFMVVGTASFVGIGGYAAVTSSGSSSSASARAKPSAESKYDSEEAKVYKNHRETCRRGGVPAADLDECADNG